MSRSLAGAIVGVTAAAAIVGLALAVGWLSVGGHDAASGAGTPSAALQTSEQPATADHPAGHEETSAEAEPQAMPAGAVMISAERQQLVGIRTTTVRRGSLDREIRTVGRVEYDETRVRHIHTKVEGWIHELYVDFTGKMVEKGQPLLTLYSPELVSTQEEYLLALRGRERLGDSRFDEVASSSRRLLEAARRRLKLWDVTDEQIAELESRGDPDTYMTLYSPIRGYVIHKGAYEGRYVGPREELYTIADLSEVWVMVDVYESELPLVRVGQPATVELSYTPGKTFRGRVDYVDPYLAAETRTAKVRVSLSNPGGALKPDMYASVVIEAPQGEGLLIPEDAVIDTGTRQVAFVVLPGGHFLPTEVQVGRRFAGQLELLAGLEEGDEIVSGATFLVDSETKLRSALRGMGAAGHQH